MTKLTDGVGINRHNLPLNLATEDSMVLGPAITRLARALEFMITFFFGY